MALTLIITIDTLRADHLTTLGYPRETSEFIAEFAKDAVVLERAYAPIATTFSSHTTILTGVYPHEHGVLANITARAVPTSDARSLSSSRSSSHERAMQRRP